MGFSFLVTAAVTGPAPLPFIVVCANDTLFYVEYASKDGDAGMLLLVASWYEINAKEAQTIERRRRLSSGMGKSEFFVAMGTG